MAIPATRTTVLINEPAIINNGNPLIVTKILGSGAATVDHIFSDAESVDNELFHIQTAGSIFSEIEMDFIAAKGLQLVTNSASKITIVWRPF